MSDDSSSLTTGFIQSEESGGGGHLLYTCVLTGRVSSRDDLHELLRDLCLAGAVHLLLQGALELLGVVRRGLHRRHARRELRGHGLLQRPEELAVQVKRPEMFTSRITTRLGRASFAGKQPSRLFHPISKYFVKCLQCSSKFLEI